MKISEQVQTRYQLEDIVEARHYGIEYQPIVSTRTGEIMAYEALARFYLPNGTCIAPDIAFQILHDDTELLCQAELDLKYLQLHYAPEDFDIFLNIDPHAICDASQIETDPLVVFLSDHQNVVIELIENISIHDARACALLHSTLSRNNVRTALDDIGAPHAMTSLQLMTLVKYLKFDRAWMDKLTRAKHFSLLESLLHFAEKCGKSTVLEGVENKTQLETARKLSIDYVQGYMYKPLFRSVQP